MLAIKTHFTRTEKRPAATRAFIIHETNCYFVFINFPSFSVLHVNVHPLAGVQLSTKINDKLPNENMCFQEINVHTLSLFQKIVEK